MILYYLSIGGAYLYFHLDMRYIIRKTVFLTHMRFLKMLIYTRASLHKNNIGSLKCFKYNCFFKIVSSAFWHFDTDDYTVHAASVHPIREVTIGSY